MGTGRLYRLIEEGPDRVVGKWGLASFYVTGKNIFVREFLSVEEGVLWVTLDEEMRPSIWVNSQQVPMVTPAVNLDYGELVR